MASNPSEGLAEAVVGARNAGTASRLGRLAARHSLDAVTVKIERPDVYDLYARETRSHTFTLL